MKGDPSPQIGIDDQPFLVLTGGGVQLRRTATRFERLPLPPGEPYAWRRASPIVSIRTEGGSARPSGHIPWTLKVIAVWDTLLRLNPRGIVVHQQVVPVVVQRVSRVGQRNKRPYSGHTKPAARLNDRAAL